MAGRSLTAASRRERLARLMEDPKSVLPGSKTEARAVERAARATQQQQLTPAGIQAQRESKGETPAPSASEQPVTIYITNELLNKKKRLTDGEIQSLNTIPDAQQHHQYYDVIYNTRQFEKPEGYNEKNYIQHENTSTGTKFYMYFKEVNQGSGGPETGGAGEEGRSTSALGGMRSEESEGGKRKTPKRRKQRRGKRATSKAKRRK